MPGKAAKTLITGRQQEILRAFSRSMPSSKHITRTVFAPPDTGQVRRR